MDDRKSTFMMICTVLMVALVAILLVIWYDKSQQTVVDDATVIIEGETQKELKVTLSDFVPGDNKSYTVRMKNGKEEAIIIEMWFDKTGADSLAPFIDVEISVDGEKVDSGKLSEYFSEKKISFPMEFAADTTHEVKIVYSMSIDVGDEAQKTAAEFNVVFDDKE